MTNRTEKRFKSLKLLTGFRFGFYPDLNTILTELGEKGNEQVLDIVNRQLSAHNTATWARDQFTSDLERVTGFGFLLKEATKKDGTKYQVPGESEADYVDRFRDEYLAGSVKFHPAPDLGEVPDSKEGENDGDVAIAADLHALASEHPTGTDGLEQWLQRLADLRSYPLDARIAERTTKEKGLPKYATEGAAAIYAGNADKNRDSQQNWTHWTKVFAKNNVVLAPWTGDAATDLKVLAQAIVANEAAEAKNKYK